MKLEFKRQSSDNCSIVGCHLILNRRQIRILENGVVINNEQQITIPKPHVPTSTALLYSKSPILIVCTNTSKIFMVNIDSNRIEKILDAISGAHYKLKSNESTSNSAKIPHLGGITKVVFSPDGSTFSTGYGDGSVKLWSKKGILRSTILESQKSITNKLTNGSDVDFCPVTSLDFSNDSRQIIVGRNNEILVYSLSNLSKMNNKSNSQGNFNWHLPENEFIVSGKLSKSNNFLLICTEILGSPHSKFRIFDLLGRQIGNTSNLLNLNICSSDWSPNGQYAILGLSNFATFLINSKGVKLYTTSIKSNLQNYQTLSGIHAIDWSEQLLLGAANGEIYTAEIFGNSMAFKDVLLTQISANVIQAVHTSQDNDVIDKLVTKQAILQIKCKNGKIVALTCNQIYIWSLKNLNTPVVIQLPRVFENLENVKITMSNSHLVIFNSEVGNVFYYDGRQISQIRFSTIKNSASFNETFISNNYFYILTRDNTIYCFDLSTGILNTNKNLILQNVPKKIVTSFDDQICFIDQNDDLFYIQNSNKPGQKLTNQKLFSNVKDVSFCENDNLNSLVALCENQLIEFVCLDYIFENDSSLLCYKTFPVNVNDAPEKIKSYSVSPSSNVILMPNDVHVKTCPFVKNFCLEKLKQPKSLLRLCQMVNEKYLWTALAAASIKFKYFDIAKLAFAAINKTDKVYWLNECNVVQDEPEFLAFKGDLTAAESICISQDKILKAIYLNIKHSKWERALQLAVMNKQHVDFVLGMRSRYNKQLEIEENDEKFKSMEGRIKWNWDEVKNRLLEI